MTASVASVPFSSSDSNQRSRIGRAAPVRISTASPAPSAQPPERASQREHRPQVARARAQQVGRRHRQRRLDDRRHALEHRLVLRVALGVAFAELRDLSAGQLGVRAHHQRAAVGERRERRRVPRQDLEAVRGQLQVADDLRAEQAVDVGGGGDLEAGEGLLGDARAADDVAPLEDQHALARRAPGSRRSPARCGRRR